MALAATRIITAMATGLLATAATSFSGDGPSPEPAPQIRPYIQASSMVNLGAFATPNGLLAAAAKAPAAGSFARAGTFTPNNSVATDPTLAPPGTGGAMASERNLFGTMPIHSISAASGSHRSPKRTLATPALLTGGGGIGNSAALPTAAGVGSIGALVAIFISNGTPEHPDAGLLIGNGADGGPGQDGGNGGLLFGNGGRGGDGVATVNGGRAGNGGNAGLVGGDGGNGSNITSSDNIVAFGRDGGDGGNGGRLMGNGGNGGSGGNAQNLDRGGTVGGTGGNGGQAGLIGKGGNGGHGGVALAGSGTARGGQGGTGGSAVLAGNGGDGGGGGGTNSNTGNAVGGNGSNAGHGGIGGSEGTGGLGGTGTGSNPASHNGQSGSGAA